MSNYNTLKTADTINTVSIVDGAITTSKLGASVTTLIVAGGGPKVTAITYPGNDLAADPAGGQTITLTGTGFVSGCSVFVGTVQASVVTVVSATSVTFTSPALAAATYTLYLVNPDGGTATIVPGISYSGTPIWSTTAGTLGSVYEYAAISNTVAATGDGSISYSVFSGTLPTGSSLNTSTGVISGTSPVSAGATTYTFVIRATDAQLQDSDRTFSITINTDTVTWSTPANNSTVTLGKDAASSTALLATSAAGNAITYTSTTLPAGLTISGATVTGTPTVIASTTSTFTATAATTGRTATAVINWTVSVASDTYFPYTTLLLSGAVATETFVSDASTNNFALAIAGDTKPNNFNPYTPGYYSNYFVANEQLTSTTIGTSIGTSDFSMECWVYVPVAANSYAAAIQLNVSTGYNLYIQTHSGTLRVLDYNNPVGSNFQLIGGTINSNTWYHLLLTRQSGTVRGFIDGKLTVNQTAVTFNYGTAGTCQINAGLFAANISNARVILGNVPAAYQTSSTTNGTQIFTPSTLPLTTVSGTALLTCQSNRFVDNSVNAFTLTKAGSPQIQSFNPFVPNTTYATYGSTYFDGTGDYLSVPSNAAFQLGTGDFTIEFWWNGSASGTFTQNIGTLVSSTETGTYRIGTRYNGTNYVYFARGSGASFEEVTYNVNVNDGAWNHIAFVRTSGVVALYVNGTARTAATGSTAISGTCTTSNPLVLGYNGRDVVYSTGYTSNVRVVKGVAVYTGTFTPPAAPLSATQSSGTNIAAITGSQTSLLTLQTNQPANNSVFLDSSTNAFAVTRVGNTSAGTFTPYGANWSNYFDGTGQSFYNSSFTGANFGTSNFTIEMWVLWSASAASNQTVIEFTGTRRIIIGRSSTGIRYFNDGTERGYTVTVPVGTWNHIAIVRVANTTNIYLNGVSGTSFADNVNWAETQFYVGRNSDGVELTSAMYLSNLRVVNGTAVYTGNFAIPTAPLTAISGTSLLICKSNSFIDNSANAFGVTLLGTPSVQRFSPFSPQTQTAITNSVYYGTKTDYISIPATTALTTFTGDFTFECWVNPTDTSISTNWGIWDSRQSGQTASAMIFTLQNLASPVTGQWRLSYYYGSGTQTYGTGTVLANQWTHVAFVRSGSTLTYYVNGVAGGTATVSGTQTGSATSNPVYIGTKDGSLGGYGTVGYISNFRIVKGVAVYTGNFTPPTAPLTATQAAGTNIAAITGTQTSLLTLQSPTLIDNSTNAFVLTPATTTVKPRTLNPFGFTNASAAYSAATYGGSAYFDGTTDYLSVASNAAFNFGTGDFTLEAWVYRTTAFTDTFIISSSGTGGMFFGFTGSNIIGYGRAAVAWDYQGASHGMSLNAWYHVTLTRSGTSIKIFVNGVQVGVTQTSSQAYDLGLASTTIGSQGGSYYWTGYISNARIVSSTAVYTSNFVPPTAPVTAITNTSLLLNMTSSGIYDSASMSNLETVADAKRVATHTPYAGSFYSNYFNGTGDYLTAGTTASNFLCTGSASGITATLEAWVYLTAYNTGGSPWMFSPVHSKGVTYFNFGVASGKVRFYWNGGGLGNIVDSASTSDVPLNTWTHIALTISGTTFKIYVNGTLNTTSVTNSGVNAAGSGGAENIGIEGNQPTYFTGYISNYRLTNTIVYSSTFAPSTTPLTAISGTQLLTCQSNRFLDNSTNLFAITRAGSTSVQSFNPFQRNSAATMYFDGTGDYLYSIANQTNNFGTGNFTVECWVYFSSVGNGQLVAAGSGTNTNAYYWQYYSSQLQFGIQNVGSITVTSWTPIANAWYHIAVVRSGTNVYQFVNGTQLGSTVTSSQNFVDGPTYVGYGGAGYLNGYINDLRITKGYARYTSTFTPPTTAFITR